MAQAFTLTESVFSPVKKLKWEWTSASDGTVTAAGGVSVYGQVINVVTIPASAPNAPSANYDITITDAEGYDVLQAAGANRSDSATETAVPTAASVAHGKLTLNVTNAGDTKQGTVILYVYALPVC